MSDPVAVLGVDGARGAWIAALHVDGHSPTLHWCADLDAVTALARGAGARVIGIDMPIGLPTAAPRASDALARAMLGARRSCLFPTPVRAVLDATDHCDAVARSRAACGKGISVQGWNLVQAITALRRAVTAAPDLCFVEVHPETSFTVLAGSPQEPKRTSQGVAQRRALLEAAFTGIDVTATTTAITAPSRRSFGVDDMLDALIACWSAGRFARGEAVVLGEGVDDDGFALTMAV